MSLKGPGVVGITNPDSAGPFQSTGSRRAGFPGAMEITEARMEEHKAALESALRANPRGAAKVSEDFELEVLPPPDQFPAVQPLRLGARGRR